MSEVSPPKYTLSADVFRILDVNGVPEILFVQLSRMNPSEATRAVSVRFQPTPFKARPESHESFSAGVFSAAKGLTQAPSSEELLKGVSPPPASASTTIDCDFEIMARSGELGALLFFQMSTAARDHLYSGAPETAVGADCVLEVSLPLTRLAELLVEWKEFAGAMK
ncbi:MAG: hypothetical protein AAF851_12710 [Myxococcota bacterium]